MHVSVTVNWCAHIARRKRTHGAKRSINLLHKDTKYIFRLVVVLWSVDLLSDHWSKSKILSTGVRYEGMSYSPQKRISQLSDYREWENQEYPIGLQWTRLGRMLSKCLWHSDCINKKAKKWFRKKVFSLHFIFSFPEWTCHAYIHCFNHCKFSILYAILVCINHARVLHYKLTN